MAPLVSCLSLVLGASSLALGAALAQVPDAGLSLLLQSHPGLPTTVAESAWRARDAQRPAVWTPELNLQLAETSPRVEGSGQITVALRNVKDLMYYGEISLGTPPQGFTMLFDTMESDFWVPNISIGVHHGYHHDASSTYRANGSAFDTPLVEGILSQDVLRVGGATLTGQYFGETSDMSRLGPGYETYPFDGYFGLGFDSRSVVPVETPLRHLVREKRIDRAMFGLFYGQHHEDGVLTLGGVNRAHFKGELYYVNVVGEAQWMIELGSVKVGGVTVDTAATLAMNIVSPFMFGPKDAVTHIAKLVGATERESSGVYGIDCDAAPHDIVLEISGREFILSKDEYILRFDESITSRCMLAFWGVGSNWMLGTTFYHKYYAAFDMDSSPPRVGFAPVA